MFRVKRQADTGRTIQLFAADKIWLLQAGRQARSQFFGDRRFDIRHKGYKFITTRTANNVAGTQARFVVAQPRWSEAHRRLRGHTCH